MSRTAVGIVGTGLMGSAIAKRLLSKGYTLTVYNRTRSKAEVLMEYGATIADTPRNVGESSDLVITVLKDAEALEHVVFCEDGLVYSGNRFTLADVSTINPFSSRAIASRLSEHGIVMLDTPVMGGPQLAEEGMLLVMVGGSKEHYERFKDVFYTIGSKVMYIGMNGSAHALKLALNLQIAMIAEALSEGMLLSKAYGIDPMVFLEALNSTYFKTGLSERKGPKMVRHEVERSFALSMMLKDIATINDTAKRLNISLPMISLLEQLYRQASKMDLAEKDYTSIYEYLERMNRL
jgi:3-hydroxyisobutyrate dehydrogenase